MLADENGPQNWIQAVICPGAEKYILTRYHHHWFSNASCTDQSRKKEISKEIMIEIAGWVSVCMYVC